MSNKPPSTIKAQARPERSQTAPESGLPPRSVRLPELLAPAGDWECARAAVENGADAIYFGLERFNARMRACNFTESDLPALMEFLHRRGVKGYLTLNTLVFQNELAEAEQYLRSMIAAGVDAVIVQDAGLCRLIRRLSPDFPIHASTQMTITSAAGVEFARDLGCQLVVLARECTLKEIGLIQSARAEAEAGPSRSPLPLEVFVHGALCVAYSGQCLTSEALGGRSANRGECAQACRMPYELIADGRNVPLGDRRYLLSPQDLAGLEVLPELVRLGVASLKIEGRLKSPEYVANITRVYRQALDQLAAELAPEPLAELGRAPSTGHRQSAIENLVTESRYDLEMAFSRGLSTGWLGGIDNQRLVHARFGKKRGVYLGQVRRVLGETVIARIEAPLKPGDGVVFDAGRPEEKEEGGRLYHLETRAGEARLGFGRGDIDFRRVHPGDKIWKTSDPALERQLRQSFSGGKARFQRPVDFEVHGRAGVRLAIIARDELGNVVKAESSGPLAEAESQPLTTERLREQLGRLGGTPFRLGRLRNHLEGAVILPVSELNRLRRECVSALETLRARPKRWALAAEDGDRPVVRLETNENTAGAGLAEAAGAATAPELIVLVRNLDQLEAALQCDLQTLYCEFEDPKKYRQAVQRFREWQSCSVECSDQKKPEYPEADPAGQAIRNRQSAIFVAPPRIFKMGERWVLEQVRSCAADGYLVRNYDQLRFFRGCRCVGDYSLNVANALAADYFKNQFALERLTASYDLNAAQLEALLRAAPPQWFEITIHQHIPMFHMEHCVFCAFLSNGTDYTNCGRPCDKRQIQLRDRVGAAHPVKADAGCRNTVFNALAQTGAENAGKMLRLGARHFRIEFLDEPPALVRQTISQYQKLLRGTISGTELWRELKLLNQLGVTRGQIERSC